MRDPWQLGCLVLHAGRAAVAPGCRFRGGRVGERLCPGESRCVDGSLEMALHDVGLAHVDDQRGYSAEHHEGNRQEDDRLTAFVVLPQERPQCAHQSLLFEVSGRSSTFLCSYCRRGKRLAATLDGGILGSSSVACEEPPNG